MAVRPALHVDPVDRALVVYVTSSSGVEPLVGVAARDLETRSASFSPPHTPYSSGRARAYWRHSGRTRQLAHTCLARTSFLASAGKKMCGGYDLHAALSCQFKTSSLLPSIQSRPPLRCRARVLAGATEPGLVAASRRLPSSDCHPSDMSGSSLVETHTCWVRLFPTTLACPPHETYSPPSFSQRVGD